jgi:hypothetical protein
VHLQLDAHTFDQRADSASIIKPEENLARGIPDCDFDDDSPYLRKRLIIVC